MSTATKLIAFVAALAVLFGGAALAGAAIGPDRDDDVASAEPEGHAEMASEPADHGEVRAVRGLAVAEDGLRVVVDDPELHRGRERGAALPHRRRGRRDRPRLRRRAREAHAPDHRPPRSDRLPAPASRAGAPTGAGARGVRLDEAGSYRLFADFSHDGENQTLATDLRVDGPAELRPLPPPQLAAKSDGGYDVQPRRRQRTPRRGGRPALHNHQGRRAGRDRAVPRRRRPSCRAARGRHGLPPRARRRPTTCASFGATFPTEGRYRLFLQFQHEGLRPDRRLHAGGGLRHGHRASRAARSPG